MLDQQVVALSKAIREHETGNRQISGATGELASRYQFLPSTWSTEAKRILGDGNAPLTKENENRVAYTRIKEWKDKGLSPGQIASMWNSGQPDMYAVGDRGVGQSSANPDVQFNVPKYVKSVYANYQKFKPKEKTEYQKELVTDVPEEKSFFKPSSEGVRFRDVVREGFGVAGSVIDYFKDKFTAAAGEEKELARREDEGEINKLAKVIGDAGLGAELITSTVYDTVAQGIKGLGLLSEKIAGEEGTIDEATKIAANKAVDFFNTETGKSVLEIVEAGEGEWKKLEESNPSLAEIVKGTARVGEALVIGGSKAGKETAKTLGKGVKETAAVAGEALETTGKKIVAGVEKQIVREVEELISPKLTQKVKELALKQGRIDKKGKYILDSFEKKVAQVAAPFVKSKNSAQKNIKNIMSEIKKESEKLAGTLKENDAIFNANQLRTEIKKGLVGVDDVLIDEKRLMKAKNDITELLINEVETKKLSELWESRKKFDRIIDSKLNAFAGVSTIKKDVSLAVRKAVNDFIVKKSPQLAKDGKHAFSDAMSKMNRLYVAQENIARKVLPSQLDQNVLGSLGKKIKSASHKIGAVQGGLAVAGIYSLGQALFNPAVISAILAYGSYKVGKTVITSKMLRKAIGTILEKSGKLLNPDEKKHLRNLADALDDAIKSEEGFARLPGAIDETRDAAKQALDKYLKEPDLLPSERKTAEELLTKIERGTDDIDVVTDFLQEKTDFELIVE